MINKQKNFQLNPIGTISTMSNKQCISLHPEYREGLKNLSFFSHALIIYKDDKIQGNIIPTGLSQKTVRLHEVNEKTGFLMIDWIGESQKEWELYDIKPYFTNEDRVKDCTIPDSQTSFFIKYPKQAALLPLGTIHKEEGECFLEIENGFEDYESLLQGYSHIKIFWWFHKFDKNCYRTSMDGQPPYENAPRTGVFACRSPIRPNPIAVTAARIYGFDKNSKRIKVSLLDSFDQTPFIGFSPYDPGFDRVDGVRLPDWLRHWPQWMEDGEFIRDSSIALHRSAIDKMKDYQEPVSMNEDSKVFFFGSDQEQQEKRSEGIVIKGASQNNLKHIDTMIPYHKITVITGVSGSGKSSLAFETIFAESRHRFLESMSLMERSQFKLMDQPKYDEITGLLPAVAISQRNVNRNPRSTVGTITDLYDLLRTLYSRIGLRHCPKCKEAIVTLTSEEMLRLLLSCVKGTEIQIYPYGSTDKIGNYRIPADENALRSNVCEALDLGKGAITVLINEQEQVILQTTQMCYHCDHVFFELTPSDFSFNNSESMCPVCKGLGNKMEIDPLMIVPKTHRSILDEASPYWGNLRKFVKSPNANWMKGETIALARKMEVDLERPWIELPDDFKAKAIYGAGDLEVSFQYENKNGRNGTITRPVEGAYHAINRIFKTSTGDTAKQISDTYMTAKTCDCCKGERLSLESRLVSIADTRFPEVVNMSLEELKSWIETLPQRLDKNVLDLARPLLSEIWKRLCSYIQAGLAYLTLDRPAPTLSGGELQRLRLVTQLSSEITNILYVLDEPSNGLHPKDQESLLSIIKRLKDLGNTIIIVEHDAKTMLAADHIIDIGPGAGELGGFLIAEGSPKQLMNNALSETGNYLSGRKTIRLHRDRLMNTANPWISMSDISGNNLKNISVRFPTGSITCITGVSGSGKSSLIAKAIYPAIHSFLMDMPNPNCQYGKLSGAQHLDRIIHVTQKPIGRSTRSNPATYTGLMDEIRILFSKTTQAKQKGYKLNRFSFNSKEGQCPVCRGEGRKSLDMQFMPNSWIACTLCKGKKFHQETLEILYKDKSIADVMDMSVTKALGFFEGHEKLTQILQTLETIGLGYLTLGQTSSTLSGGESQRIKLAAELSQSSTGKTLYLLDEPTAGLHFSDIQNLLLMLDKMVQKGNTVVIVEHNLDMIKHADWIIDLGLEGGQRGGDVVAQGTPSDIEACVQSYTGQLLRTCSHT